jgi:hypothetical protein
MASSVASLIAALLAALFSCAALAVEPAPAAKVEVEALLARLATSGCKFQRNGSWHSATEARSHLQKKYQYLLDKHRVGTAEDFISLAATKSSISGAAYQVKCGAQEPVPSAAWMAGQLKEVRAKTR